MHDLAAATGLAEPEVERMLREALRSTEAVTRLSFDDFRALLLQPSSAISANLNQWQREAEGAQTGSRG